MDIGDQGLDIGILSEDEVSVTQNGDPVDADFDVICSDEISFSVSDDGPNEVFEDLPAGLLSALKKDADEAAQAAAAAAAAKELFEGNITAIPQQSSTASTLSYTAISTAHETVSTEHMTGSTAYQSVPAENQTVPSDKQTVLAENQTVPADNQTVLAEKQTVSPVCQALPSFAANQTITTPHQIVSMVNQIDTTASNSTSAATVSADPAVPFTPTPPESTATVPKTTGAQSDAAYKPSSSCLTTQMKKECPPSKDLVPIITRGVDINELVFTNSDSLEDEWSCVETQLIVPGEGKPSNAYTVQEAVAVKAEPVISFEEAMKYFKSADMSEIKPKIHQTIERRGFSALAYYFFGPPKLRNDLLPSKELTFCIAATTFDNHNSTHVRSLLALHRNLTGAPIDCRRFGNHWETIGFQGNDPSTDLRGVGLFGLLQLLYITSKPEYESLKKQIFNLSNHKPQNFPFSVMGLNLSKLVLQTLREDKLNRLCNKRDDLITVVNETFVATYYKVYHIWKSQNKTIVDSGFVIKEVETLLRKSPQNLIRELEEYVKNPNAATAATKKKSSKSSDKLDDFVGIADIIDK